MRRCDPKSTITKLAGLLTVPELQANAIRLEILVHLAAAHCTGRSCPNRNVIARWINKHLGSTPIAAREDPVEDVFVTNVGTPEGNFLLFQNQWEQSDYFLQTVIDVLGSSAVPHKCQRLLVPSRALLALSDCVAKRLGLQRWNSKLSFPQGIVSLPSKAQMNNGARAVTFTSHDLKILGIDQKILESFVLRSQDKHALSSDTIGHSSLERRPLIELDGDLVLALPHAVSPAIRRFVITELWRLNCLSEFSRTLATHQFSQVSDFGLLGVKGHAEAIPVHVQPTRKAPSFHSVVFRYDIGKYINVVLLHDHMDRLRVHGLASFIKYPEQQRMALEEYITRVAQHCRSLPGFTGGVTLLVNGGLGSGFASGLKSDTDDWRFSAIQIPHLLMLASELHRPLIHYLRFLEHRDKVVRKGAHILSIGGDYNLYCYWKESDFRLTPADWSLQPGSLFVVPTNSVLPVRQEIRTLMDRHVLQTTDGSNVPVMRLGVGTPFKSLQDHPVYASLSHLAAGQLGGAVETSRGTSWLLIKTRHNSKSVRHFLYQMWTGFISLYRKLVLEIDTRYPDVIKRPVAVQLDFDDVILPEHYDESMVGDGVGKPEIKIDLDKNTADVRFPSDLLAYFRHPENTGERLVLRSITKAIMGIYHPKTIDESSIDALVGSVLDHSGIRIFHVFRTYDAVEWLLNRQKQDPNLFAYENFNFCKLGLSEGCTRRLPGNTIDTKAECNAFLHCIVGKVIDRLRERLRRLSRVSVIRMGIEMHESAIQDRVHWRRTAQAILALYAQSDDVHAIAQDRESDRTAVSVAARTILEMAICDCPSSGGRDVAQWDFDELIAEAWHLVEVATDSDAIYRDLTDPRIELHANGEYTPDRSFQRTVIKPFMEAYHREGFEEAAQKYSELYRNGAPVAGKRADEVLAAEFISAFRTEYGLTPDDVLVGLERLMSLAVERESVVVGTTLGNVKAELTANRGSTSDACEAFIRTFSICHRPEWDKAPLGFKQKELYPWRFRRRLSCAFRPVFVFGARDSDSVLFGAGSLRRRCMFLMERTEAGHLPQDFFETREMKQYIGAVNNERGHAFARSVAEEMRENGWNARSEVQMVELGASVELGDVDVLAWKTNGDIRLIECKRLQLARTVAEIAEICRRFQGEAKDELAKHVQRVEWIGANPKCLQRIVGFVPERSCVDDRLVTNTHVPMTYLGSLPISADKIGTLGWSMRE